MPGQRDFKGLGVNCQRASIKQTVDVSSQQQAAVVVVLTNLGVTVKVRGFKNLTWLRAGYSADRSLAFQKPPTKARLPQSNPSDYSNVAITSTKLSAPRHTACGVSHPLLSER